MAFAARRARKGRFFPDGACRTGTYCNTTLSFMDYELHKGIRALEEEDGEEKTEEGEEKPEGEEEESTDGVEKWTE
jgi:hypothetical protein